MIFLIFLFLFVCCQNPFSMREPESPKDPRSNWVPAYQPEQVIQNFQNAIAERNIENYIHCFIDSTSSNRVFRFYPDQNVAVDHPDLFGSWDLQKEMNVMQQAFSLIPSDSISKLLFIEKIREVITSDSVVLVHQYQLELNHAEITLPQVYQGQSEFWLTSDLGGEWAIYHWIDYDVLPDLPSWSNLKVSLGGG